MQGVLRGYSRSLHTCVVAIIDGVVNVRSMYRRPLSIRKKPIVEEEFVDNRAESVEARRRTEVPLTKVLRINYDDLAEHGFTGGCQQCDYNSNHQRSKPGVSHSAACRERFID